MPKCGRRVRVENQEGEVISQNVLDQSVTVRLDENQRINVPVDKIQAAENQTKPATNEEPSSNKPRTRAPSRSRKNVTVKEPLSPTKPEEEKSGQTKQSKPTHKRRGPRPVQRDATTVTEGEQSTRKRPRRKSRPKQRPPQNTPSGDKQ